MKMPLAGRLGLLTLLLCALPFLVGCGTPKPRAYGVRVTLDPALRDQSVRVDLVGVQNANLGQWEGKKMSEYWADGDPLRRDTRGNGELKEFNFISNTAAEVTLPPKDPIWPLWLSHGANHLFVLADLPGAFPDEPGDRDPRRKILPLNPKHWAKRSKELEIQVRPSGVVVLTPTRPR